MKHKFVFKLSLGLAITAVLIIVLLIAFFCRKRKRKNQNLEDNEVDFSEKQEFESEDLILFQGGENLCISDILDSPGEVIWKSSFGTLYKANLQMSNSVMLLRFIRPACSASTDEILSAIQLIGSIRHSNLLPLKAFYAGPRGEKLLVHPFYGFGTLAHFIREGTSDCHSWTIIYRISMGIAQGLCHLHTGLEKSVVHGNLKSRNVLLDQNYQPYVADFGLHLLLNPSAAQGMLDLSAAQGYKAPELIKMKEASEETDIYSLGVIFLEMLTGKEPINADAIHDEEIYLPNMLRNAILNHRITDLYHQDILLNQSGDHGLITEAQILKFFQLAMACCSPSPSLRPNIKQVLRKLEEIEK
ncbi:Protein kinase domain [Dillenia turbinata]|uniref:Protein kinase domain n=1 Tax=Dillenia turbinata TaxID=194707 RepID=A0AAN8Z812_9MAGN